MAGTNPLVPQGTLNRALAAVAVIDSPELNVSAFNTGVNAISIAFEGEASAYLGTLTGAVASPNPYQIATITMHLLKSQPLSFLWELQRQTNSAIGDVSAVSDSTILQEYYLSNCVIRNVAELSFAGTDPGYVITIQGTYPINGEMFN